MSAPLQAPLREACLRGGVDDEQGVEHVARYGGHPPKHGHQQALQVAGEAPVLQILQQRRHFPDICTVCGISKLQNIGLSSQAKLSMLKSGITCKHAATI